MIDTLIRLASLGTGLAALWVIWLFYLEDRESRAPTRENESKAGTPLASPK